MTRLHDWFANRGWKPFDFQEQTWQAYRAGRDGLLHAPTGMGKTLAVAGGPMLDALETPGHDHCTPMPLQTLWITPLRALAADTDNTLRNIATDLELPWSVELRTGDSPQSVRQRQRTRLPSVLITTPESISILLSYAGAEQRFGTLRCIVVDEWHELLGSKRGVQTELALARLRTIAPQARLWGMSATLANTEQAMHVLLGPQRAAHGVLVRGELPKTIEVDTILPESTERFPWAGHLGTKLLAQVIDAIERAQSTLLFTNTRSQTEIWFQSLLRARPDWIGDVALHHGSLDRKVRGSVETMLADGALRCVVCTSSLDLGVDFTPVDQVIQIGSPKGIARMLQRAGRSGHQPGAVSRILGVPTNALELIEYSAAREAARDRRIEPRIPIDRPLDVLVQHLVTIAMGDGFKERQMLDEVRSARAFEHLSDDDWQWAMDFVTRGGPTLGAYEQYAKVVPADGRCTVPSQRIARMHRMSIGTINSDTAIRVRYVNGRTLGSIEESFITRLRPGDRFVFAGKVLELVRVRDMTAQVRRATSTRGTVPRWMGGRSPLSTQLADAVRARLDEASRGRFADAEMQLVRPLLELQSAWSIIPAGDELLIETTSFRGNHHAFVFTLAGRLVNEGLSALVAHRMTRLTPTTIKVTANDYGFECMASTPLQFDEPQWRALLTSENLLDDLLLCLNDSALARRRFRDIARIAGLIYSGYPGQPKAMRHVQASSDMFFDVFSEFDPDNLLLDQARREVLERELEFSRLVAVLERLDRQRLVILGTPRFTPLAFPLWAENIRSQQLSSERWIDRVQRMVQQLEQHAQQTRGKVKRADADRMGV